MKRHEDRQMAYFSLGSNLGDRKAHLQRAVKLLEDRTSEKAISSPIYRSEPWGYSSDQDYYNCCIGLPGKHPPRALLRILLDTEAEMGRIRVPGSEGYTDREIDIDFLFLGEWVLDGPDLILPHPRLHERRFVLKPLAEIAPHFRHPVLDRTISDLLAACPDTSLVSLL